ncbi:hypothetical protein HRbin30_01675 [bacterium HR30]|nr:hypothetical protein HRbin30_01675 [bacterium HR30]
MPTKTHGGAKRPGGPDRKGSGPAFPVLPESTRRIVIKARSEAKLQVHPWLELSKFVEWKAEQEEATPNKRAAYNNVATALQRAQSTADAWRKRRSRWLSALGAHARTIEVEAVAPCVLWLGAPTPVELGFCLHHTYGLPYLPGSGLKGLARAAMRRELTGVPVVDRPKGSEQKKEKQNSDPKELLELFGEGGDKGQAGRVDFLDGIPAEADCLELEVMSPHHFKYYQQGKRDEPHDCEDPRPLPFLRIRPGSKFEIALVARETNDSEKWLEQAQRYLLLGLAELGLGAKTSSGYGVFQVVSSPAGGATSQPASAQGSAARSHATSQTERREVRGAVIEKFDLQADLLVFRDPDGNCFEASVQECEKRFSIKRTALGQMRRDHARFRIVVVGQKVVGVYKE